MNIHKQNFESTETKVDRLIEIAQRFDVFGICEVNQDVFKLLSARIKEIN